MRKGKKRHMREAFEAARRARERKRGQTPKEQPSPLDETPKDHFLDVMRQSGKR